MTNDELIEIEKYGALMMPPYQVACIMQIDIDLFNFEMQNNSSEIFKAYYKGLYTSIAELRTTILAQAKSGSSPAQTIILKQLEETISQLPSHD
jgi:hypothetical protein